MTHGRLKVLQVIECGGPGGTGNQVVHLCNSLDPKRFEVGLVYAVRPGHDASAWRGLATGATKAFHVPALTREISPMVDARALNALRKIFASEKPDVVHLHSSKAGAIGRAAAKLAGVKRVFYTPHGYGFLQEDRAAHSRAIYRAVEKVLARLAVTVAVSPSEAELARGLGGKVELVCDPYLGEWPSESGPAAHDGTIVASCGRLTYARRPEAFVNLAQRVTDSRNGLKAVWIGGGELEPVVRRDLENMNLLSKVEVTGWLPQAEALARLRKADVFVHYSRWEGLPNAVLEAMAHGLPVVASDVHGNRDAVVDGATGFLAKTEVELLEKTLALVDDPALRRKMGEAGRARARALFDRDKAAAAMARLYEGKA